MLPELHTRRLRLRAFQPADAAAVTELAGDRAVADTTLNVPHPYEPGLAEAWIATHAPAYEAGELATFAITRAADAVLLGAVSLTINRRFAHANLGYWIGRPYWNEGICTEAAARVLDFGFDELDLHRVFATHLERNPASGRVMQKLGMQREGLQREHTRKWDRWENLVLYGVLRSEWRQRIATQP